MKNVLQLFILLISVFLTAQTGVVKGKIADKQSEIPLEGVTIELLNMEEATGVVTNEFGRFTLNDVPVGRQSIRISYIGFETYYLPNIEVTTGKDVSLNITLTESFNQLAEVVISSNTNKDKANNEMAIISARQFNLEEVNRFSGGRGDIGRLASNFAGVSAPDDSRNDIVVRGNSPSGLLWRLEGIPIPSPNHFSTAGATGSPVSALNPNMLKSSDFLTSAFPAEYGNALGGVFDLGFRSGNADDYEFAIQAGAFTGFEVSAEGPLGKKNGSFLVAGRYGLIGTLGLAGTGTSAIPNYNDISFNIHLGDRKAGRFSIFGIFGSSDIEFLGDDIDEDDLFSAEDEDLFSTSSFGVAGLKHTFNIGDKSFLRTVLAGSFSDENANANRYVDINMPTERKIDFFMSDNSEARLTFSTLFNSKISNKTTLRTGILIEQFNVKGFYKDRNEQPDNNNDGDPDLVTFRDMDENVLIIQPYVQGEFRLTEDIILNAGLHSQYANINKQFVVEPRAALGYQVAQNHKLSIGYGLHHQNIPLPLLFLSENINGNPLQTNKELDFVQSHHFVLGYDVKLAPNWRSKIEFYYQNIDKAGVEPFSSSYSTLTEGATFGFGKDRVSLVNEGKGTNQGVEITLEKFFTKGYYGMLTGSFFESKYKGSDGVERNSPFNNNYVVNALAGKEIKVGKAKKNVLFFDTKLNFSGGRYFTPVDLLASQQAGYGILQENLAYSQQYDAYFRWDVKMGFKLNSKNRKVSHQIYFDFQNVTNNKNVFVRRYNRLTNSINQVDQIGFSPDFGYRFQF